MRPRSNADRPGIRGRRPVTAVDDPFRLAAPTAMKQAAGAVCHLGQAISAFPDGIVLRGRSFCGVGASGPVLDAVRKQQVCVGLCRIHWLFA